MQYWQRLHEYLVEIDRLLNRPLEITLIGGAALIFEYHHIRVTYDIDILNSPHAHELCKFVAEKKNLKKKFNLPIHVTDTSFFPITDDFLEKRKEYSKEAFKNLKVYVLDVYDLVLSKLDRCDAKDRDDIQWLKESFLIDADELIKAYKNDRLNTLNAEKVDGNFLYIMEVVFGRQMEREDLCV